MASFSSPPNQLQQLSRLLAPSLLFSSFIQIYKQELKILLKTRKSGTCVLRFFYQLKVERKLEINPDIVQQLQTNVQL